MNANKDLVIIIYKKSSQKYFGLLTLFFKATAIKVFWWQNKQIGGYGKYR